jgi:hypothetical protein
VGDENAERFHQDISSMEKRYRGKWNCAMLANYMLDLGKGCPYQGIQATSKTKKTTKKNVC